MPTAAHFIYIPGVLLLGMVVGWILGSRAAADAYAAKLRRSVPNAQARTSHKDER
jgi:Tfp pilus assembly protein PilF